MTPNCYKCQSGWCQEHRPDPLRDKARHVWDELGINERDMDQEDIDRNVKYLADVISAAYRQGQESMRERAAKVVEEEKPTEFYWFGRNSPTLEQKLAKAIRALEPETEGKP